MRLPGPSHDNMSFTREPWQMVAAAGMHEPAGPDWLFHRQHDRFFGNTAILRPRWITSVTTTNEVPIWDS